MKYYTLFITSLLIGSLYANYCKPFSYIQSSNYKSYFPKLQNYQNEQIIQAIQNFETTQKSGSGGHGIVKLFIFDHQGGYQKKLALKKVTKSWRRKKLVDMIEDEVVQWQKVVNSHYVPYYYGCFESPNNSDQNTRNSVYILQEALSHDLQQKPIVQGSQNLLNIKVQLPKQKDRIEFYIKLFTALEEINSYSFVHNDIKPQNIMLSDNGYNGDPIIIDFGLSDSLPSEPIQSTPCYEFKGKGSLRDNTTKFDVFSMGISIIEFETDFSKLCYQYNQVVPDNYDSYNVTQKQQQQFYSYVLKALDLQTITLPVSDVSKCNDLRCILLFTVQPDINQVPSATQVKNSLISLYRNLERIRII